MAVDTPVYMHCKGNKWAANWSRAKHVSGYCACSCADANSAQGEESSLVECPPPADETSLVDGTSSAATDDRLNAAMDHMKKISKKCVETLARVARCMEANEGLGKRVQRAKKESDVQANAVRKEHAEYMADDLFCLMARCSNAATGEVRHRACARVHILEHCVLQECCRTCCF